MIVLESTKFLSARPGRGATPSTHRASSTTYVFLSARPGRGATRMNWQDVAKTVGFLSARPGRGATSRKVKTYKVKWMFLSARPGRGATTVRNLVAEAIAVSIRTPRAGRDRSVYNIMKNKSKKTCFCETLSIRRSCLVQRSWRKNLLLKSIY